ncbi:hypothetical protein PybrP1_012619 [[Pythium] brassicae (nom. inval.)]|nr:hypothetical protein PybrP1_012619 [[Pythium] brassicae (nom. inval.)]
MRDWATAKFRRLRAVHAHFETGSARWFYARLATKFGDNVVYALEGAPPSGTLIQLANAMAQGRAPTIQQEAATSSEIAGVQDGLLRDMEPLLGSFAAPIGEDEIRSTLRWCMRFEATGPDGLLNDWYRDHEDHLTPLLLRLFSVVVRC